jgi:thioredoxin-like negative regulator of GroEL
MRIITSTYNNSSFLNNLLQKNKAVVFFVAPWCGHCQRLEPTLNKLMGRFSTLRRDGVIARINEGEIKNMNIDKDIQGFPTIRVLNNGKKEQDYNGPRDEESLNRFLYDVFKENQEMKTINISKYRKKKNKTKKAKKSVKTKKAKKSVKTKKAKKSVKTKKEKKSVKTRKKSVKTKKAKKRIKTRKKIKKKKSN